MLFRNLQASSLSGPTLWPFSLRGMVGLKADSNPGLKTREHFKSLHVIELALANGYKQKDIVVDAIRKTAPRHFEVTLHFWKPDPLMRRCDHVSAVQIQDGLLQAANCAISFMAIDGELGVGADPVWFQKVWDRWALRNQKLIFSDRMYPETFIRVQLTTSEPQVRGEFLFMGFDVRGPVRGKFQCVLPKDCWPAHGITID